MQGGFVQHDRDRKYPADDLPFLFAPDIAELQIGKTAKRNNGKRGQVGCAEEHKRRSIVYQVEIFSHIELLLYVFEISVNHRYYSGVGQLAVRAVE